ncbi:MAG TPA: L-rhamnonate dehydratase [Pyrinomonadaceae bacterium]|nr:L-rhamnonate dehydratase [Pyrinomonadaceae bacterium]
MKQAKIREVRAYVIAPTEMGADYHNQQGSHWIIDLPIANPMSVYEQYRAERTSWGINALGTVVVQVELSDGTVGIGCSIGGEPACYIIEKHLSRFVQGQDPRNVELIWDQMWRATMPYGRKGLTVQAISAVDLAIWDCLGKLRDEPVYALIGGKTKEKLPVYATTSRPDIAQEWGFQGAKIPCRYGPAEGKAGLKKNVEVMAEARSSVGPDFPLRLDCYMALTVPYAIQLAKELAQFDLLWIEECLPPDDFDGYATLKSALTGICLVTTGEHEYTRYGFRELIARKCADILQPDINWVGGLTEARRIVAMAAAYDIPVIPHGSSVFSYHMQYAFSNCPIAEFLVMSPRADQLVPLFGELFTDEPMPRDGYLELNDKPGWGVTLNHALKLVRPYESERQQVTVND